MVIRPALLTVWLLGAILPRAGGGQDLPYRPPLYWSVYEHHILKEQAGVEDNYIPEAEFLANIDWVDTHLRPFGFDMVAVDGWGDVSRLSPDGYRTSHSRHWEHDFAWWSAHLRSRGMRLGMYGNPLWIHVDPTDTRTKITGTDIPVSSLIDPGEHALWFTWVQVDRPGAEAYVKGHVAHFAAMGIDFLRVDFLSWFETGYDRNLGVVGTSRPREHYETALRWMREACDEHGVYLSLVMPNLHDDAGVEKRYGHMMRISEDTGTGGWRMFSEKDRGVRRPEWSQYANVLDGFAFWSPVSGRDRIRLDGDFVRINTFDSDAEKRTVISAHLMAGGPVAASDQHGTIGDDVWAYQNPEMLALNGDGFVGSPLSSDPSNERSQIWAGRLSGGDWVVGLFNRETDRRVRTLTFQELGIPGTAGVRDLWQRADLGTMDRLQIELAPHASLVARLSSTPASCTPQTIRFEPIADRPYGSPPVQPVAAASSGLPVSVEVAHGPASRDDDGRIALSGSSGRVYLTAFQAGDAAFCAAIPVVQSFEVVGGHQAAMYVAGTFTGWSPNIPMTLEGDWWIARDVFLPAGAHELKFANSTDWTGEDWGASVGLSGTASRTTGGLPNIRFTLPAPGRFDLRFNDFTLEYAITASGATSVTGEIPPDAGVGVPFPNPASHTARIGFMLPAPAPVMLSLVDPLGRVVRIVNAGLQPAGPAVETIDVSGLPAGPYLLRLRAGRLDVVRRIAVVR